MEKRMLGKLEVSSIGLGCMGMTHAYGAPSDEQEMIGLMHEAFDLGITMYDTAECYTGVNPDGTIAYNEELVGKGIKAFRDKIVLATKCGVQHSMTGLNMDACPEVIRQSIDGSLKRLDVDYVDLYYLHRVDPKVPVEDVAGVMQELMDAGKIRAWGISEASVDEIRRAHAVCPLSAVQSRYSMITREHENTTMPVCEELGIGYVAFSPLGNGFLSAAYNKESKFTDKADYRSFIPHFKEENIDHNQPLIDLLHQLAAEKQATPAQIALAWMLAKKPFIVPIPGTRKSKRLIENTGSANVSLSMDEMNAIEKQLVALGY